MRYVHGKNRPQSITSVLSQPGQLPSYSIVRGVKERVRDVSEKIRHIGEDPLHVWLWCAHATNSGLRSHHEVASKEESEDEEGAGAYAPLKTGGLLEEFVQHDWEYDSPDRRACE